MEQLKKNWKELLLLAIGTALIIGVAWALFHWQQAQQEELRKAQELTQAQEQSMENLQTKLKISEDMQNNGGRSGGNGALMRTAPVGCAYVAATA